MSATSPAEPLLRALRYLYRLPMLAWHVLVHLPVVMVLMVRGGAPAHA